MRYITGLICLALSVFALAFGGKNSPECALFLYHHKPVADDLLLAYDWVVLDGDTPYIQEIKDKFYLKRRAKLIGYISVGEIERYREYLSEIERFAIGENPMWNSLVADIRKEEYRRFLIEVVAKGIAERGFDGFLLDTLDSYRLVAKEEEYPQFKKSLVEFIKALKEKYPDKLIILNRGFELLEEVHQIVDGVVVESLFRGLNEKREYVEVEREARKEVIKLAEKAKKYGLPVIVIDYVPPENPKLALETAHRIKKLGFIPYIADKELSLPGLSPCTPIPRKVILLYDSRILPKRQEADTHRVLQMPLEYLGFVPELYDVNEELPELSPWSGYVGVASMFISNRTPELDRWLVKAKELELKLFFLEDFPFYEERTAERFFGLRFKENKAREDKVLRVVRAREGWGFEAPLKVSYTRRLVEVKEGKPVVVAKNSAGQKHVPFALTDWGGYAISGTLLTTAELWVYDPFEVLKEVFKSDFFPIPDTTTENGRRILTAHIDGDAFFGDAEFDPNRTTGEVIRDEIIKEFPIPHTVSVVEAEVAPYGLYPEKSAKLEEIAKSIFSLPNVEVASHSFSHPFTWQPEHMSEKKLKYGYNLKVPGYTLDFEREILGSVQYINDLAREADKRVKVFLWTGYCDPNGEHLKLTYRLGIFNVNGGDTTITETDPFLTRISPMGVNYGPYFQVYAPVQNENIYTNEWTGPYWGYINVLQTFKLTGEPRRLKPVSIYYHFYSGQKLASLNALKKVYSTVLKWEINPMFLSEYAGKVLDFRGTAIIRKENGFLIRNSGFLRTLRVEKNRGYPDLKESRGIVGFKEEGNLIYIHLDGSGNSYLKLTPRPPRWFNLISSNGKVVHYEKVGGRINLRLLSHLPAEVEFDTGACEVKVNGIEYEPGIHTFRGGKEVEIEATCPD
ncbi:MAG: polysaccharide deacetylase [Aquificae bacterium]|nr:polysaccharide deacetylase [Aquificota bacterium]